MTEPEPEPRNPATAQRAEIDRFSAAAATLFVRTADNGLPAAGEPIDFDQAPFITWGFGPAGERTAYYNFDVQPLAPAPIWVFFRESDGMKVDGQLNVVDAIPGDDGYNDFWQVIKVMVPDDYVANTVTSREEIVAAGYSTQTTDMIVNCPIVPEGSTAELNLAGGPNDLIQGWYRDMAVFYFTFMEAPVELNGSGEVAQSPIYVSFNINPGEDGGGPPSGFMTEGTVQTHNVVATLPGDAGYSPLWDVNVYDNADFFDVHDLETAMDASRLANGVADVNCPVVAIEDAPANPDMADKALIDRFSGDAGHLFVRTEENGMPAAGEPIDFDQGPFITHGLSPVGTRVSYYNFDVQPLAPAPIFVLFREGEDMPVRNQLNIVDVVPGDEGYNDFWQVVKVTVPDDYVANTITSLARLMDAGYSMEATTTLVNCPIVPDGSTAELRWTDEEETGLVRGWYKGQVVYYFSFFEAPLSTNSAGEVPRSPIWVAFNINPGEEGGGPPSGFMTEPGTDQTHNVIATVPGDGSYSPLWHVNVYDNADFDLVMDLGSARDAERLAEGVAHVNCPVVDAAS
jgi:hypothetical protein